MRGVVLGHHQQARGVLVQAVQDAGAQGSVHVGQALELEGQGVGEGSGMDAVAGMGDHALGLVHHQDMLVLVGDGEGDVLRNQGGGHVRFRHEGHGDFVACGHGMVLLRRFAVDEEAALFDPFLDAAAGGVGGAGDDEHVEPQSGFVRSAGPLGTGLKTHGHGLSSDRESRERSDRGVRLGRGVVLGILLARESTRKRGSWPRRRRRSCPRC